MGQYFKFFIPLIFINCIHGALFDAKTHKFQNGFQLVVVENTLSPSVVVNIVYNVGTAVDPLDLVGLSHFLEHLMFKGTKQVPDFQNAISFRGGWSNASTTSDKTSYICEIASEHLDLVLKMEADRMVNLSFTEEQAEAEKLVVLEERLMRLENHPLGKMHEAYQRSTYTYHPYGVLTIGYPHHIKNYSYANALKHYKTWYAPNNAILIVVGNVRFEDVKKMAEEHFGKLQPMDCKRPILPQEPSKGDLTQQLYGTNKRLTSTLINYTYEAPSYNVSVESFSKDFYFPLIVLKQVLTGNSNSRFYRTFIEDHKICSYVEGQYGFDSIDPSGFELSFTLNPDAKLNDAKNLIEDQLKFIAENGVTLTELERGKRDVISTFIFMKDNNVSISQFLELLSIGLSIDTLESFDKKIQAVTLEQVNKAAQLVFGKKPVSVLVAHPQEQEQKTNIKKTR